MAVLFEIRKHPLGQESFDYRYVDNAVEAAHWEQKPSYAHYWNKCLDGEVPITVLSKYHTTHTPGETLPEKIERLEKELAEAKKEHMRLGAEKISALPVGTVLRTISSSGVHLYTKIEHNVWAHGNDSYGRSDDKGMAACNVEVATWTAL